MNVRWRRVPPPAQSSQEEKIEVIVIRFTNQGDDSIINTEKNITEDKIFKILFQGNTLE